MLSHSHTFSDRFVQWRVHSPDGDKNYLLQQPIGKLRSPVQLFLVTSLKCYSQKLVHYGNIKVDTHFWNRFFKSSSETSPMTLPTHREADLLGYVGLGKRKKSHLKVKKAEMRNLLDLFVETRLTKRGYPWNKFPEDWSQWKTGNLVVHFGEFLLCRLFQFTLPWNQRIPYLHAVYQLSYARAGGRYRYVRDFLLITASSSSRAQNALYWCNGTPCDSLLLLVACTAKSLKSLTVFTVLKLGDIPCSCPKTRSRSFGWRFFEVARLLSAFTDGTVPYFSWKITWIEPVLPDSTFS